MLHSSRWSQENCCFDVVGVEFRDKSSSRKDLRAAFRVTDVVNLSLACFVLDLLDESGHIIDAHLFPREVPELFLLRAKRDVLLRPSIASIVSHPDIVTSVC